MFLKSFVGACIAGAALSLRLIDQTPSAIAELLSQTAAAEISADICLRTATRNKADLPKFYDIYREGPMFTDSAFSHDGEAFAWTDAEEVYDSAAEAEGTEWKRASEVFPGKTLYGTGGITP